MHFGGHQNKLVSVELGQVKNTLKQGKVFYILNTEGHRKLGNSWNMKCLKRV